MIRLIHLLRMLVLYSMYTVPFPAMWIHHNSPRLKPRCTHHHKSHRSRASKQPLERCRKTLKGLDRADQVRKTIYVTCCVHSSCSATHIVHMHAHLPETYRYVHVLYIFSIFFSVVEQYDDVHFIKHKQPKLLEAPGIL